MDRPTLATEPLNVKSPASDTIIIRFDPATGWTSRHFCERCYDIVMGHERYRQGKLGIFFENGVGDPLYFLGAGVEYDSEVFPLYGRVAWARTEKGLAQAKRFAATLSNYERSWRRMTGVSAPKYLFS